MRRVLAVDPARRHVAGGRVDGGKRPNGLPSIGVSLTMWCTETPIMKSNGQSRFHTRPRRRGASCGIVLLTTRADAIVKEVFGGMFLGLLAAQRADGGCSCMMQTKRKTTQETGVGSLNGSVVQMHEERQLLASKAPSCRWFPVNRSRVRWITSAGVTIPR